MIDLCSLTVVLGWCLWNPGPVLVEVPIVEPPIEEHWHELAQCESGGDWGVNTGNGYYGGLQFDQRTWRWVGGIEDAPRADQATREQQVDRAERLLELREEANLEPWAAWPVCSREVGLR